MGAVAKIPRDGQATCSTGTSLQVAKKARHITDQEGPNDAHPVVSWIVVSLRGRDVEKDDRLDEGSPE